MRKLGSKFFTESGIKTISSSFSMESMRLNEAEKIKSQSENNKYDIFLSHSSKDKKLIIMFKKKLVNMGYSVYVDWIDDSEARRNEITPKLKVAMNNSYSLLYVHTHNSENSKWTPWEIGYFDSKKGPSKIGVMPILNDDNDIASYNGQEYLEQYNQIGADYLDIFVKQSKS